MSWLRARFLAIAVLTAASFGSVYASNTISGVVYDTDGTTPVTQGQVLIFGGYDWSDYGQANLQGNGTFQTPLLPDGAYRLRVDNPPSHLSPEYYGDTIDSEQAIVLFVTNEAPITGIVFILNPGGIISGHVYGTNGTWAAGESVHAAPAGQGGGFGDYVNADGSYSIRTRTGEYYVNAGGRVGYIRECWPDVQGNVEGGTIIAVTQGVTTANIDFQLELGGSISGRVFFADGVTPVSRGLVGASIPDTEIRYGVFLETNGTYWMNGILPGDWKVSVSPTHGLPLGAAPQYYDGKTHWDDADLVTVTVGQISSNVNFTLPQGGAISGCVYDTNGITPLVGFHVEAKLIGGEYGFDFHDSTDGNGFFYMALPVGEYLVRTSGDDIRAMQYYQNVASEYDATPVSVTASNVSANINFTLQPGGSISGHVYGTNDSIIVTQGWVTVYMFQQDGDGLYMEHIQGTQVQPDGTYLLQGLPATDYKLEISDVPLGWLPQYYDGRSYFNSDTVPLGVGQDLQNVDFRLKAGGMICGHIYETNGVTPISDVWANAGLLVDGDANQWQGSNSDADGYFAITVAPGTYIIQAGGQNGYVREYYLEATDQDSASNITVVGGVAVSNINFTLLQGATISGYVYLSDGTTPVPQGYMMADDAYGEWIGTTYVHSNGFYSIGSLPPGPCHLKIEDVPLGLSPEYYSNKFSLGSADLLNLTVGEVRTNINFTLKPGGAISGYLFAADGVTPVEEWVRVVGDDGIKFLFETYSDAVSGYYYMQTGTGTYKVVAGGDYGYQTMVYTNEFHISQGTPVVVTVSTVTTDINFALGTDVKGWVWLDVTPNKAPWTFISPLGIKWDKIMVGDAPIEEAHNQTLETGVWQVVWQPLPGYDLPVNSPGILNVVAGQTNGVSGVYIPLSIDSDNDGMYDWEEWLAGTDPSNSLSCLRMMTQTNFPAIGINGYVICWSSVNGRYYVLERATNMLQGFAWSISNIPAYSPMNTYTDTTATGSSPYFYRVRLHE